MIDSIISITNFIAEYSVDPIVHQLAYLWNYKKNMDDLKAKVEKLDDARGEIHGYVVAAERNAKEIKPSVLRWQNDAAKISMEARKTIQDEEKTAKKTCLVGLCPNPVSRYWFSKKARKEADQIVEAQKEAEAFKESVSYPAAPAPMMSETAGLQGYVDDSYSRTKILQKIMEALKDDGIKMIGVYGLAGVGKTTLLKRLAAHAYDCKLFDEIVMAPVTQTPDLKEIQGAMAKVLGLKLDEQTVAERAGRLWERIKKKDKILVILDDLWGKLDLEEVGIPFGATHKGCKILLTSRFQHVLSREMGTDKEFLLEVLTNEEAWSLFEQTAGAVVHQDPTFHSTAKKVAEKCGGLPVLIVAVARALKDRSLAEWKDASKQLRKSNNKEMDTIEISYNLLRSDEEKSLFLLCGLIMGSSQIHISDLLKYSMGLDLFEPGGIETVEDLRNRLQTSLYNLKGSCLLQDVDKWHVKMHEVVRDVAVEIAAKDRCMFKVPQGFRLKEWPKQETLTRFAALCIHGGNSIAHFPQRLKCPLLEFFYLEGVNPALKMPDTFFERTETLKVLELADMCLSPRLPSSLGFLKKLQTLSLCYCELEGLSVIGELKKLKALSFTGSNLQELPREIGQLSELRLLDLGRCSKLKVIPPDVLSSLSKLEELLMKRSFVSWEVDGLEFNQRSNASVAELKHLPNLSTLYIHIPDAKLLPKDLYFDKLEKYRMLIGDVWDWSVTKGTSRRMKLKLSTSIHLEHGIKELLKTTDDLCLDELEGVKSVIPELDRDGFPGLKHLNIKNNAGIRHIVNAMAKVAHRAFPVLESLVLNNLFQLEKLCNGTLMTESFCNLKTVSVYRCNRLKYLFTPTISTGLVQLQNMTVKSCTMMKEIVAKEDHDVTIDTIVFPQLVNLFLDDLPNLTRFCSGSYVAFPSLKELCIWGCPAFQSISDDDDDDKTVGKVLDQEMDSIENLHATTMQVQPLFNEKAAFPCLERLLISGLDNLKTIWCSQLHVEPFLKLRTVIVKNCSNLSSIFPLAMLRRIQSCVYGSLENQEPNMKETDAVFAATGNYQSMDCLYVTGLPQLVELIVNNCGVESIVEEEEKTEVEVTNFFLPQLTIFGLEDLPKLKCFYPGKYTMEWPCLKELCVCGCDKVEIFDKEFICFPEKYEENQFEKVISNLEFLTITSKGMMKIMHGDFPLDLFFNLRRLRITGFHDESGSCPSEFLRRFYNLERLSIRHSSFQQIFPCEGPIGEDIKHTETVLLSCLRELKLRELPKLERTWKEGSPFDPIFQKLESLEVWQCPSLMNLVPSLATLKFLNYLDVWDCASLINLVQFSTAQSLSQLRKLKITGCRMMQEIVASKGDHESEDEVTFGHLKYLELGYLPSLKSFCSGSYTLKFPKLIRVIVTQCPNMRTFSQGTISTPKLETVVHTTEEKHEGRWEGDLNATIQKLFSEMEALKPTTSVVKIASSSNNHHKQDIESTCEKATKPRKELVVCESAVDLGEEAETFEVTEPRKESEISPKVIEPGKLVDIRVKAIEPSKEALICEGTRAGNEAEIFQKPLNRGKETETLNQGPFLAPSQDNVVVVGVGSPSPQYSPSSHHLAPATTNPSFSVKEVGTSKAALTCQQKDFKGLCVQEHLIPLLEKAQEEHGEFCTSDLIKSKPMRTAAMETVGEILHILQNRPLNTISAEHVQFMDDSFHDLSHMNFPVQWLHPYIDKATKCFSALERQKVISELKAEIGATKARLEELNEKMEEALKEENQEGSIGSCIDFGKPVW